MPPFLSDLQEKIDKRVLRERVLLFMCVLAVLYLLWGLIVQNAFDKRSATLNAELKSLKQKNETLQLQLSTITAVANQDPNKAEKETIAMLTAELAELDLQLSGLSQGLVSADELPQILQNVLLKTGELSLVQLQTLQVQELKLAIENQPAPQAPSNLTAAGPIDDGAGVFKHEVSLRVTGGYFELLTFLQSLEQDQWRFYWEQLNYTVADYPQAEIELRVFTLSAEEGLLGV